MNEHIQPPALLINSEDFTYDYGTSSFMSITSKLPGAIHCHIPSTFLCEDSISSLLFDSLSNDSLDTLIINNNSNVNKTQILTYMFNIIQEFEFSCPQKLYFLQLNTIPNIISEPISNDYLNFDLSQCNLKPLTLDDVIERTDFVKTFYRYGYEPIFSWKYIPDITNWDETQWHRANIDLKDYIGKTYREYIKEFSYPKDMATLPAANGREDRVIIPTDSKLPFHEYLFHEIVRVV